MSELKDLSLRMHLDMAKLPTKSDLYALAGIIAASTIGSAALVATVVALLK